MKAVRFQLLAAEDLHRLVALDGFTEKLGDIAHGALNAAADVPETLAGEVHHQTHQGRGDQQNQRQFPVLIQQEGEQADHGEAFAQHHDQGVGAGAGDLLGVEDDLRHDPPGGVVVVFRLRQTQHMAEHVVAQPVDDFLGHPGHRITAHELAEPLGQRDKERRDGDDHHAVRFRVDHGLAQVAGQLRGAGLGGGVDGVADDTGEQDQGVGLYVRQQTFVRLPGIIR